MIKLGSTLLILILFAFPGLVYSNNDNYIFRTFSPPGGFYYDGVKSTQQDQNGFVWIMMDNDLYRFDGYEHKRYYTHFAEWEQSADWCFNGMVIDQSNHIFVATNDGLYVYDSGRDIFHRVLKSYVESVNIDARENLWVRINGVMGIFDRKKHTVNYPKYNGQHVNYFRKLLCNKQNKDLYTISTAGKVFRFDYVKNEFFACHAQDLDIEGIGYVLHAQIARGKLWVLIQNRGLYKLDLSTFNVEKVYDSFVQGATPLRTFCIDKNENIWIATIQGIYILDVKSDELIHYKHSKDDEFSLPNNSVWAIDEDTQRNLWIGTYSGKVCYVNLDEKSPFQTYLPQFRQLNHAPVSSFVEDDKYLWIGTEGGGLNRMDRKTNKFDYYKHIEDKPSISSNNIKSMILDNKSNLWIGTFSGGLDYLDTANDSFTNLRYDYQDKENTLISNDIRKIVAESDSGLWIAYQYKKLILSYLSYSDKKITHYSFNENDKFHYVFDILKGRDNKLWILGHSKLFAMDINTRSIQEVTNSGSLILNGRSLATDDSGNLWIGTIGKGLIKYDTNTSAFTQYRDILAYNTSSIYGVCYDNDGGIWMGTDNGLFKYDIGTKHYSRFDKNDGIQGLMYYPLSVYKGLNDIIYFGGTDGFTSIDPRNLGVNLHKPKVIFSNFYVDNEPIKKYQSARGIHKDIVLDYDQINFGFMISSDNYLMPEKNHFQYRLRGYNDEWTLVDGAHRLISYTKIPAGTYYFEVMTANNDGIWNKKAEVIKIRRKTAPWFSWFAYVLYGIVLAVVGYTVYHYYREKKKLTLEIYLDKIEKNKQNEIHESQLRFFTNISHDFRTPLSLILGVVERLREEGLKEYYYRILHGNSQRLLNLVNELMDFRAVENGKLTLEVEKIDVNNFVAEIASTFHDYARQRNQRFEIKCDNELRYPIYVDKYVMEKVIMNLLNNAFKYTPEKGAIVIETKSRSSSLPSSNYRDSYRVEKQENMKFLQNSFSILVRDTGVGISKESIPLVFDRFYKVKTVNFDSHIGTGIGLALCKGLTLLHKGMITIYSERNKGTDIEICFPKGDYAYSESEIKQQDIEEEKNRKAQEVKDFYDLPEDEREGLAKECRKKILLVEDHDDLRHLIRDSLSTDYEVVEAENGMVASNLLIDVDVDLILSDIMMPLKDGVSLCAEVKRNVETSHIPFFMLSAKTSVESKIEGADSGADIYFEKPLNMGLLKISIENIFKQRDLLKEYYAKNYFAESAELTMNERDNKFLKNLIDIIDKNIDKSDLDVNYMAAELSMSRSKLYSKIKKMTGKSIVEFILNYRLRKAARMIIEEDMTMREIISCIGIESQPYFTNAFKKEFGKTPTAFASEHKKTKV